jgi:hypothetical protein
VRPARILAARRDVGTWGVIAGTRRVFVLVLPEI